MWAGLSCFLSSGDGYVGELLELQQGCEVRDKETKRTKETKETKGTTTKSAIIFLCYLCVSVVFFKTLGL